MTQIRIRIRERNQITLPAAIATAAKLQPEDTLEVDYVNGVITLVPVGAREGKRTITQYVGSAKGLWGKTRSEIDANILAERDAWER